MPGGSRWPQAPVPAFVTWVWCAGPPNRRGWGQSQKFLENA